MTQQTERYKVRMRNIKEIKLAYWHSHLFLSKVSVKYSLERV